MKIVRGDKVLVIAGKDRGKTGTVKLILSKRGKLIIEGINVVKKHLKKSPKNPHGGIIDKEMPIDRSNVMLLDPAGNKPTRVGLRQEGKKKVRISRLSGEPITAKTKKNDKS